MDLAYQLQKIRDFAADVNMQQLFCYEKFEAHEIGNSKERNEEYPEIGSRKA